MTEEFRSIYDEMIDENGKSVRENNLAKAHNIPIGALVEVKYEEWHGDGACSKVHARLFVVEHTRDCDGTPLYALAKDVGFLEAMKSGYNEVVLKLRYGWKHGFRESRLTRVVVTPDLIRGENQLSWDEP